jgi:hypothetical protein
MNFGDEGGDPMTNNVFEYLFLHNNAGQQFASTAGVETNFDNFTFQFLYMLNCTEDHFEMSGGVTIRDSVIGPCSGRSIHNDFFQFTGNYIRIYNNDIRESANAVLRLQTLYGVRHDFQFFNNIVTEKAGRSSYGGTVVEPLCMVHFDPQHPSDNVTFSNILFANNLFYSSVPNTIQGYPEMSRNPMLSWSRGRVSTPPLLKNVKWVNNLVVDKEKGVSMPHTINAYPEPQVYDYGVTARGYAVYSTNDVWVDYNSHAATNETLTTPRQLYWMDQDVLAGGSAFQFSNNTNYPAFKNKENDNFELLPTDITALNTGYDMSAYFAFDALNRPRGVRGAWDRGPLELQESQGPSPDPSLLAWFNFDDEYSDGKLDDGSGRNNHAYRFGRPGSVYPTNFPARVAANSIPGRPNVTGYAGDFRWYADGWGLYGRSGDYAAITNVEPFRNLEQMTVALWARYHSAKRINPDYNYSVDSNGSFVSTGTSTGVPGTWGFGRLGEKITLNNTRFSILTNGATFGKHIVEFPDRGFDYAGDTLVWHHYALTFSNGVCRAYFDGQLYSETTTHVKALTVAWNNNVWEPFIGIGCNTHGGSPALEDEPGAPDYPNNGFFNGAMDDLRIYKRALSPSEIQAVYAGMGGKPKPPGLLQVIARN